LILSQERYAEDVIRRAGMSHCKPINTPLSSIERLSAAEEDKLGPEDSTWYRSIVGAMFTSTRPNIPFAVNKVC
jgi:hypothetical protein